MFLLKLLGLKGKTNNLIKQNYLKLKISLYDIKTTYFLFAMMSSPCK